MTRHRPCSGSTCVVDAIGHTDCGTVACPSCGSEPESVSDPAAPRYADQTLRCSCGCRWQPHAYGPPF